MGFIIFCDTCWKCNGSHNHLVALGAGFFPKAVLPIGKGGGGHIGSFLPGPPSRENSVGLLLSPGGTGKARRKRCCSTKMFRDLIPVILLRDTTGTCHSTKISLTSILIQFTRPGHKRQSDRYQVETQPQEVPCCFPPRLCGLHTPGPGIRGFDDITKDKN